MNFNLITKEKIDKGDFDQSFRDENYEKVSVYFYKIASIVANKCQIRDHHKRQDIIQDSVFVAFKRKRGFDFSKKSSAYSYFYKLILNHFKDVLRKEKRRYNIATMVSYEKTEDNVYPSITFDEALISRISAGSKEQTTFIDYKNHVNFDYILNRRKRQKKAVDTNIIQTAFATSFI